METCKVLILYFRLQQLGNLFWHQSKEWNYPCLKVLESWRKVQKIMKNKTLKWRNGVKATIILFFVQGLRWHGFEGLSLTRQYLENGSRTSQFLGISNRNKIFWHFNCLNLDTLTLSGKIRTHRFKTHAQPLCCDMRLVRLLPRVHKRWR